MIKFKTINIDGVEVERVFDTIEDFAQDWYGEDTTLPQLDDEMVYAEVENKEVVGEVFNDLVQHLWVEYGL